MDFIEINGVALRCELSGKGDHTLVLIHEMGGALESWDDVAPRFAETRRVLRYDQSRSTMSPADACSNEYDNIFSDTVR